MSAASMTHTGADPRLNRSFHYPDEFKESAQQIYGLNPTIKNQPRPSIFYAIEAGAIDFTGTLIKLSIDLDGLTDDQKRQRQAFYIRWQTETAS